MLPVKYLVLILLFSSLLPVAQAQEIIYPETFPNLKGVKVIRSFSGDTLVHSYSVGTDGKLLGRTDYKKGKVEAKDVYSYENGKLVNLKSFQERDYIYDDDSNATAHSPIDFRWDSSQVTFEIKYTQGADGIVSYKYFANHGNELLTDISCTYYPDGRLKREDIKSYPKSGLSNYTVNAAPASPAGRYKEYAYEPNLTTIYYYINGKLTGTENIVTTTDGRITTRVVKNTKGRNLGQADYNYNTRGQLMEITNNDTGEDAFGKGHTILFDKEVYTYDEKGRMVAKVSYLRGTVIQELTYKYDG